MFKRKQKLTVTIEFSHISGTFYYPKDLPIPRINEFVQVDDASGTVIYVNHITKGTTTEIRIICHQYK